MSSPETNLDRLKAALADRYRIKREIGEGGMATVYLAQDLKHDRAVALKVLKPELAALMGGERFLTEIKTTANLQHPHILPLFDSGEADGFLFYVMPYIEGESLRERISRERQLPVDQAVSIASAVAGALDYAHRHDVVHRDIKPGTSSSLTASATFATATGYPGQGRTARGGSKMVNQKRVSPFLFITVATLLLPIPLNVSLRAQEPGSQETGWWGGLALGGTGEHLSTLLMAGTRKDHRLLSVRWNAHLDGHFILAGLADTDYVSELGVLYGFQGEYRWFDGAVSAGPSWVFKTTHPGAFSNTEKRTESSVGVMVGSEATLAIGRSFAVGVQGYGGVSSLETLWGVGWVVKFGQLRSQ